jgi:hypothetical protein
MRLIAALALATVAFPTEAVASELIARGATNVKLQVSRNGQQALLSYRAKGRQWYVLAKGAINAKPPIRGARQVAFQVRRSTTRPSFKGSCRRLKASVPLLVTGCSAGGSNWAAQTWKPRLRNFGVPTSGIRAQPELHLSHWSGPLADLTLKADWSFGGRFRHVYGKLTYRGSPVYGFTTNRFGSPTDAFGRNIYLDTLDSAYGPGWKRENSFVARRPTGVFCYDLTRHNGVTGDGKQYRGTVIGPGVTPDVQVQIPDPGPYDPLADAAANAELLEMAPGDPVCKPS